jgi:hypothetical protein
MKKIILFACISGFSLPVPAQVDELQRFRKAVTIFVNYDNGKIDSLPKTTANSALLKGNLEKAFMDFVMNKNSKDLVDLKKNSINNRTDYIIGNTNYTFQEQRRDRMQRSAENNINFCIEFYGLYDYRLSNFVSFYIQPFKAGGKDYVVYYYKLNGAGLYYIKDVALNEIVYKGEAFTSVAAIITFSKIDKTHFLLLEDMGDQGQRALVLDAADKKWKIAGAFSGKGFTDSNGSYQNLSSKASRQYLRFAETKTIKSLYGEGFLKKYEIKFDEATQTISYKQYHKNEDEVKTIQAKWENGHFRIDDYYIGSHLNDQDLPMPQ